MLQCAKLQQGCVFLPERILLREVVVSVSYKLPNLFFILVSAFVDDII